MAQSENKPLLFYLCEEVEETYANDEDNAVQDDIVYAEHRWPKEDPSGEEEGIYESS